MNSITIENFILFVSAFSLGWILATVYFNFRLIQGMKIVLDNLSKLENAETTESKETPVYLLETTDDKNYYLYDKDDRFVRQAKSIDILATELYAVDKIDVANIRFKDTIIQFEKGTIIIS